MNLHRAIYGGCRQLGIEEDDRRDLYVRVTGKSKLTRMTYSEQQAVVAELRRMGFKPASKAGKKALEGKYAGVLQLLWIAAWNLDVVPDPSDRALLGFVKRQTGIDHSRWLRYHDDATRVIEAIKARIARDGGVEWKWKNNKAHHLDIVPAQMRRLGHGAFTLETYLEAHFGMHPDRMVKEDWHHVMNVLGCRIRTGK